MNEFLYCQNIKNLENKNNACFFFTLPVSADISDWFMVKEG